MPVSLLQDRGNTWKFNEQLTYECSLKIITLKIKNIFFWYCNENLTAYAFLTHYFYLCNLVNRGWIYKLVSWVPVHRWCFFQGKYCKIVHFFSVLIISFALVKWAEIGSVCAFQILVDGLKKCCDNTLEWNMYTVQANKTMI